MKKIILKHLKFEWKFWITTVIAFLTLLFLWIQTSSVPNAKDVAVRLDMNEIVENIDMDKLANIISSKSGVISPEDLNKKKQAIPIPTRKPQIPPAEIQKAGMTKLNAACLMLAAQTYSVPPAVLTGIYKVEEGVLGKEYGPLKNGIYEIGLMRISSKLLPDLAEKWGVEERTARRWLRDDPCTNMGVAAWILRQKMNETGNLGDSITFFRYDNVKEGHPYKVKVVKAMRDMGLLRDS